MKLLSAANNMLANMGEPVEDLCKATKQGLHPEAVADLVEIFTKYSPITFEFSQIGSLVNFLEPRGLMPAEVKEVLVKAGVVNHDFAKFKVLRARYVAHVLLQLVQADGPMVDAGHGLKMLASVLRELNHADADSLIEALSKLDLEVGCVERTSWATALEKVLLGLVGLVSSSTPRAAVSAVDFTTICKDVAKGDRKSVV